MRGQFAGGPACAHWAASVNPNCTTIAPENYDSLVMQINAQHLIWIDLEMTGLDPDRDQIIEIATLITDKDLNELAEGPVFAIHTPESRLQQMDQWNTTHHRASGLWQRCVESRVSLDEAQRQTLAFVQAWVPERASPICGNSICQDRRFLARGMPELEAYFHYRNLDVSTLKELARRWAPDIATSLVKQNQHLALSDIRESVLELRHYRKHMGAFSGLSAAELA
jgi:oligoribonuclease